MDLPRHPFWDFSLRVYGTDGVARACLALQDSWDANVNLLLFCCWCGSLGHDLVTGGGLERATDAVAAWDGQVVRGLRAVRRRLKTEHGDFPAQQTEALRQSVLSVELDAEHMEQLRLVAAVPVDEVPGVAAEQRLRQAARNVSIYLQRLGFSPGGDDLAHLDVLLGACFPDLGPPLVRQATTDVGSFPERAKGRRP